MTLIICAATLIIAENSEITTIQSAVIAECWDLPKIVKESLHAAFAEICRNSEAKISKNCWNMPKTSLCWFWCHQHHPFKFSDCQGKYADFFKDICYQVQQYKLLNSPYKGCCCCFWNLFFLLAMQNINVKNLLFRRSLNWKC